ncbi:phospholipid scramblase 1-like isoform X2 [Ostrea edulis]|nr:phospholipid scramblase 1-like isoform X2 [Ostrea edulis]
MTDIEIQNRQQPMEGEITEQPEAEKTRTQRQPPMEGAIIKRPAMQGAVIQRQPQMQGAIIQRQPQMQGAIIQRQPQMQGAIIQRQPGRRQPMEGAIIKMRKWMEHPGAIEGVPPGMEPLVGLDHVLVKQIMEYNEMTSGSEGRNEYDILNKLGEQIYKIKERSEELQRIMYGNCRAFIFPVRDRSGQEVMRLSHEKCQGCTCSCIQTTPDWGFEIPIEAPPGVVLGYSKEWHEGSGFNVKIMDADRQHLYMLNGDTCACQGSCCPNDLEYPITDGDGNQVANIYKRWAGSFQESMSDADTFGLT